MIVMNGKVLAQGSQFSLSDVEVITATFDLDEVTTYRASMMSRTAQAAETAAFPRAHVDVEICSDVPMARSSEIEVRYVTNSPSHPLRFLLTREH